MARLLINNKHEEITPTNKNSISSNRFLSEREYLNKRSKEYLEYIANIDTKTLSETKGINELMEAIQKEFGTAELDSLPEGIVAKCFLGHPYEVHTLDFIGGNIVRHYKSKESMPDSFEKARSLAKHNAYAFVEVYRDKLILVREDGTVTKF
jgi:hypothetical protein